MNLILAIPFELRLAILFVLGCCVGAMVNLGIYCLAWYPKPISPWSRPAAEAPPRRLSDRLPVIGWFGRRREATLFGSGFWIRPMLLELLTGAIFAVLYWWEIGERGLVPNGLLILQFGGLVIVPDLATLRHEMYLAHIILSTFMLIAFWIDVDEMTIPDGVTIPCTLLGLAFVTLWPLVLLPDSSINSNGAFGLPAAMPVWLNSPDEAGPAQANLPPLFVMPWARPALMGNGALVAGIAVFWIWCLALLPGLWSMRHGYWRAVRVFTARAARERTTYWLIGMAVIGSAVIAWVWWLGGAHWAGLETSLAGIAIGGGLVWLVRIVSSAAMGREAMGFGDVTLMAMIGAWLGWQATIIVFFLAPLVALAFAIGRLAFRGEREIPFGPFLCIAAFSLFFLWRGIFWGPDSWWELDVGAFSHGWLLLVVLLACFVLLAVLLPPMRWLVTRLTGRADV